MFARINSSKWEPKVTVTVLGINNLFTNTNVRTNLTSCKFFTQFPDSFPAPHPVPSGSVTGTTSRQRSDGGTQDRPLLADPLGQERMALRPLQGTCP